MAVHVVNTIARSKRRQSDLPYGPITTFVTIVLVAATAAGIVVRYLLRWKGWRLAVQLGPAAWLLAWFALRRYVWNSPAADSRPVVVVAFLAAFVAALATIASLGRALLHWHEHRWFDLGRDPARAAPKRPLHVAFLAGTLGFAVATWSLRTDWDIACRPDDPRSAPRAPGSAPAVRQV